MELEEMELDLTPGTGIAPKTKMGSADGDARARALAVETGAKWKCSRVKRWVNSSECVAMAKDKAGPLCCKECSTVAALLLQQKVDNQRLGKSLPSVEETKSDTWKEWSPFVRENANSRSGGLPFATMHQRGIWFSALAVKNEELQKYESCDLYYQKGVGIGVQFYIDREKGQCVVGKDKTNCASIRIATQLAEASFGVVFRRGERVTPTKIGHGAYILGFGIEDAKIK